MTTYAHIPKSAQPGTELTEFTNPRDPRNVRLKMLITGQPNASVTDEWLAWRGIHPVIPLEVQPGDVVRNRSIVLGADGKPHESGTVVTASELQAEADAAAAAALAGKVAMVNDSIKAAAVELQGCIVMLATDYGIMLDSEAGYNQVHDAIYNPALPIDGAKRAELKSLIDSRFNTLNYRWEKATGKDDAWANLGVIQQAMIGG